MRHYIITILICLFFWGAVFGKPFTIGNANLQVKLDNTGRLMNLTIGGSNKNFLDTSRASYLLMLQPYGADNKVLTPISLFVQPVRKESTHLVFLFEGGYKAVVEVIDKGKYLHLKLVSAEPLAGVAKIHWGPVNTTMKEPIAEYLGLLREGNLSLGMLSLEPNTDGTRNIAGWDGTHMYMASYNGIDGSKLMAESWDHTRNGVFQDDALATAIPDVTVKGSAVALFGCIRSEELNMVEAIALNENLPHPTVNGIWNKRSDHSITPQTWVYYKKDNFEDWLQMANAYGCNSICNWGDLFGNWGHFTPNPVVYPEGLVDLKKAVKRSDSAGLRHVLYTLSTFLLKRNVAEPFISPQINSGFERLAASGNLQQQLDSTDQTFKLKYDAELFKALNKVKYISIGKELIELVKVDSLKEKILLQVKRGAMDNYKRAHPAGSVVYCIPQGYIGSFCPGTIELQNEVMNNIVNVARSVGFKQLTIDGYESCVRTGHGAYAKNLFSTGLFKNIDNPELVLTSSNFGNYDWHMMSHISWGENDREKGFRGTMLDYRVRKAFQLRNNLMPRKLGQFYPADAESADDFQWLMALATGWDAGMDFYFDSEKVDPKDKTYLSYGKIVSLWTEARHSGFFTEAQKLAFRQTDRLYELTKNVEGKFDLKFKGRWTFPGLKILPPSVFKIESERSDKVKPCSIDWSWTHNPGIYVAAGVSDDMIAVADGKKHVWNVTYPRKDRLQFVIHVPANAACAIRNPVIILNDNAKLTIPIILQPGQYLSTTMDMGLVNIYNSNHEVISEVPITGLTSRLPAVVGGKAEKIEISAEADKPNMKPVYKVNVRTHEKLPEEYDM